MQISEILKDLGKKGVIEKCNSCEFEFISGIFLVPKPDGSNRLILNLKNLNSFIDTHHFKLEDGRTVTRLMSKNCYMSKLDLKDAYYLVSIHISSRKYLRFEFEETLYEFTCLPFGLNIAPFIFTKMLKPVVSYLRELGLLSVIYLDDILLLADTYDECLRNVTLSKSLLQDLGFIINYEKSDLIPSQACSYLGFIYNSREMTVGLPIKKRQKIKDIVNLKLNQEIKIKEFARILGVLVSSCVAVNYGWVYTKASERAKYLALEGNNNNYDCKMIVTKEIIDELKWWNGIDKLSKNPIRETTFELEIFTDASLSGWGAFCNGQRANGHWRQDERSHFINHLELLAAYFGLKVFANDRKNCQIILRIDNTTAICYINRMGGVQYENLSKIAKTIWQWCEKRNIWIFASYIASKDNIEADFESRRLKSNTEIELNNLTFNKITRLFGNPDIDLFVSRANAKCKLYVSWRKDPESIAIDAFTISWKDYFFYAFPPVSMILRTLQKIRNECACGIMVVPNCPSQPWYPLFKDMLISKPFEFKAKTNIIFSSSSTDRFWNKITLVAGILSAKH